MAFVIAAPLLFLTALSMACNWEQFEYGKHFVATEEFVSAQSTAYAESVRITATTEAPTVRATATAMAGAVLVEAPETVRSLHDRYGINLVNVPAGEYISGADLPDAGREAESVHLDEFWIGLTEVTNGQFAAFVEAGGYDDETLWTAEGWEWRSRQSYAGPICAGTEEFNAPDQPVTCVNLYEAQAFVTWLSRESGLSLRLPSAEEWEKAARGPDGARYPWGDDPPSAQVATYAAALGHTAPAGSSPKGASPYGILDMAGNVAEWTRTPSSFSEDYVVRGGSWFDYASALVSYHNRYYEPGYQENTIGFRIVAEVE